MHKDLVECESPLRGHENLPYQVICFRVTDLWEREFELPDKTPRLLFVEGTRHEGRRVVEHGVEQHSQAPDVCPLIVVNSVA